MQLSPQPKGDMFLVRGGAFTEEPFHIRLGFYRENFGTLARAMAEAAAQV
ncbi:hypothetical protein [Streptomyces echinatus]|uniref:Uncharacterized protein n=1 Tax=Streptomyces echinatus TaxID=67293 RepID=A0A7W9PWT3_9ACTN|nr:hypothetical protein [Streptomyces echinatus]MBB5929408.1 hypothetical protein [Streptomyces echinatus]